MWRSLALLLVLLASPAHADCTGLFSPGQICGNPSLTVTQAPAPMATRIRLTQNTTFFVDSALGVDQTGCGLASGTSACATCPYMTNILLGNYDAALFFIVTVQLNGTFTVGCIQQTQMPGVNSPLGFLYKLTNGSTIDSGASPGTFVATGGAQFSVGVVSGGATVTSGSFGCVSSGSGGYIIVNAGLTFGPCADFAIVTAWGGTIITNNFTVTGNSEGIVSAQGGVVQTNPGTVITCTGSPTYSIATVWAYATGVIGLGNTWSGCSGVTAQKFLAQYRGVIADAGNTSSIPGGSAGAPAASGSVPNDGSVY